MQHYVLKQLYRVGLSPIYHKIVDLIKHYEQSKKRFDKDNITIPNFWLIADRKESL